MCLRSKYVRRLQDRNEAVCRQSEALSDHYEWLTDTRKSDYMPQLRSGNAFKS